RVRDLFPPRGDGHGGRPERRFRELRDAAEPVAAGQGPGDGDRGGVRGAGDRGGGGSQQRVLPDRADGEAGVRGGDGGPDADAAAGGQPGGEGGEGGGVR